MSARHIRKLHRRSFEPMVVNADELDEEPITEEVAVCGYCFAARYPGGCDDDYIDSDVFWPCPTIKELRR